MFCSIAVLHFETDPESNIRTAEDALWWAFATITTVGYGDCYPVTWEGRLIATILMCAGVGLFGTFSAFLAAWFIGSEPATCDDIVTWYDEVLVPQALCPALAQLKQDVEAACRG